MGARPPHGVPSGRLEERFVEKNAPMTATEALCEASRCLYCHDAPCIKSCPTAIDIPTFIRKIATGNLRGAARTILSANLLGASCARVCPVEVLCESTCVFETDGREPIAIGRLQRHALEHGGEVASLLRPAPATGRSFGLIGAGPASLACAGTLALMGHRAVIYERRAVPGGLNASGVAPYKLTVVDALTEVEMIRSLGVEIECGVTIGVDVTIEALLQRHEALFLAPGLGADGTLGVPGEDGPGVMGAVAWIERMKLDPSLRLDHVRSAIVVGGGNTAIDCARELAVLGVADVRMVYRRSRGEMSGYRHELDAAIAVGVRLVEDRAVVAVLRSGGGEVAAVRVQPTRDGSPIGSADEDLPCDLVLVAIGQGGAKGWDDRISGLRVDARGRIEIDSATGLTGHPRVFAGGDAVNGGREVVDAVADGQRAARVMGA